MNKMRFRLQDARQPNAPFSTLAVVIDIEEQPAVHGLTARAIALHILSRAAFALRCPINCLHLKSHYTFPRSAAQ